MIEIGPNLTHLLEGIGLGVGILLFLYMAFKSL